MSVIKRVARRGFDAYEKEAKEIEKRQEEFKNNIWRFFLKDGEEDVPLRFLTEEPIIFYEHTINVRGNWENIACTGDDCEYCDAGEKSSIRGAWLIADGREFESKRDGKTRTLSNQIRIYSRGSTDIAKIQRLVNKYGLTNRPYYVTKTGSNTTTSYELDRGEEEELTLAEKEAIFKTLPEKYRKYLGKDYDNQDKLLDIVDDAVVGGVIKSDYDEEEEEEIEDVSEEVTKPKPKVSKKPLKRIIRRS